jgi:hypothetical protein
MANESLHPVPFVGLTLEFTGLQSAERSGAVCRSGATDVRWPSDLDVSATKPIVPPSAPDKRLLASRELVLYE